jgi:hypothetical protein
MPSEVARREKAACSESETHPVADRDARGRAKAQEADSLGRHTLARYVSRHPVEVIRSPQNQLYVIDRHHTLAALWLLGVKKVTITHQRLLPQENVASTVLALPLKRRLVHLYDQFGNGPPDPMYLPKDVSGIGDDQCRSLAWLVESVAHMKSRGKHYFEFEWAQFFPERKLLQPADISSSVAPSGKQ